MLAPGQSPFPDHQVCKQCLTKPCRRLFVGQVYPGKMIFVHHRDLVFLPSYKPDFRMKQEDPDSTPALTDDIEVITGKVEITNPRWELIDDTLSSDNNGIAPRRDAQPCVSTEIPFMGDTIRLLADVNNYPDGASVTFDIYDITEQPPFRIATVIGTNDNGTASVEWMVEDPQQRSGNRCRRDVKPLRLSFEASAKSKYTQKTDLPWQDKLQCDFVEIPDVLFHPGSAVPCIDEKGTLVAAITAAYRFTIENPGKELVLFGHADTSGDTENNYDLSQWRAEGVKALLDNDAELWLDIIGLASKIEDYRMILKTLAVSYGWSCDPGTIDNVDGLKTKAAVEAFQEEYNSRCNESLTVDGIIGTGTWKALFAVARSIIEDAVKKELAVETLPPLAYAGSCKGICACGEGMPIDNADKDNYRSAENRRVEMVFFDKGKSPDLSPFSDKKTGKKAAVVYDKKKTEKKPITAKPEAPVAADDDEIILYDPGKNEYWEITEPAEIDKLITEAEYMNGFAQKIQDAWNKPVFGEQCEASTKNEEEFKSVIGDKQLAEGQGTISELLAVKTNKRFGGKLHGMVYIRKYIQDRSGNPVDINGHWRKHTKDYMENELREFLQLGEKSENKPEYKTKATFWKKDFDDKSAFKFGKGYLEDNDCFCYTQEAQLLRFAAGASINATMDLRKGTLKLGGEGNLTLSLAEGTITGGVHLPDKNGCNILSVFTTNDKLNALVKEGRVCLARISVQVSGYGFIGASATAFIGLPNIDFSRNEKTGKRAGEVQLGAEAGAGASATAGGTLVPDLSWKEIANKEWRKLTSGTGRLEGSLGIAGSAKALVEYKNGKFRFKLAVGAVMGIGGKVGVEFELDVAEGYLFIVYILRSFDYHYVDEIRQEAFDTLFRMSVAQITGVEEVVKETTLRGKELVKRAYTLGTNVGRSIKKEIVSAITNNSIAEHLRTSIPEAKAAILLGIMETPQEEDFDAILAMLRPTEEHELKSILRCLSEMKLDRFAPDYPVKQGIALQEGMRRMMKFGRNKLDSYDTYNDELGKLLNVKNIKIQK